MIFQQKKLTSLISALYLITTIAVLSISAVACANTLYCDSTNGNDANNGSKIAPFKTIQKAIESAIGQTTIKVGQGIYKEHIYINKNVSIYGGHETKGWTININAFSSIVDGRGVLDFDRSRKGSASTVVYTSRHIKRDTVLDGFTIYGPSVLYPSVTKKDVGSAIAISKDASPTISNVIVYGPEKGQKIYTLRMTGKKTNPLFKNCKIYGGKGTSPVQSKLEIITPWTSYPEFEDCEVFPGKNAAGSHRTVLGSKNSHNKFTNVIFHPAEVSENPNASYFRLIVYLKKSKFTKHYDEFYNCTFYGANSGKKPSHIIYTHFKHGVVDYSKYVLINNDFILGRSATLATNKFSDINLEEVIKKAGGKYQNNRFWNSVEEYRKNSGKK